MQALETTTKIDCHSLVVYDAALPAHAESARIIVMWEVGKPPGRRVPPPTLAGMGEEKEGILGDSPESDWDGLTKRGAK